VADAGRRTDERPNILYLHAHDTGRYVSPYGHAVPTPHIRRLAEEGVTFRQAFSAAPTCSPSRAALLTGQWAHCTGMLGLAHRGFRLRHPEHHLAATLRAAGYATALAGVQHVAPTWAELGYERGFCQDDRSAAAVAPVAVDLVRELGAAADGRPFFLDVGFFETHRVFPRPDSEDDPRWVRPPAPLPDTPETRADMAAFHASVRALDGAVGAILRALDEAGLAASTLVVCTTDHGLAFPAMKCNLTAHGTGVMLIVRGPAGFGGGRVVDALVSQIDLFPTLCDAAALPHPAWLQGRSLLPLLAGEQASLRDETFAEVTYHAAYEPQRGVRTPRWSYARRYDGRTRPVLPNCDDGPSRDLWLRHGWAEREPPAEALFDLVFDPNETANLAADPAHAPVLEDLRGRLDAWMRATDDPLLGGDVPLPPGAAANDPDDRSFDEDLWFAEPDGALRRGPNPRTIA
jgi:arylsulfatase A-like enzyme